VPTHRFLGRSALVVLIGCAVITVAAAAEPAPAPSHFAAEGRQDAPPPQAEAGQPFGVPVPDLGIRVRRHNLLLDVPRGLAIFNLWFSEPPDFQKHAFQHHLSSPELGNFSRRSRGAAELLHPFLVVRPEDDGKVVVRQVDPTYDSTDDPQSGGWGPKAAESPLRRHGRRVQFTLQLSIFGGVLYDGVPIPRRYEDWAFAVHYFLEVGTLGQWNRETLQGVATVARDDAPIVVAPNQPDAAIYPKRKSPLVVDLMTRPHDLLVGDRIMEPFFAELADVSSLRLGPTRVAPIRTRLMDIDGDGYLDRRLWFTTARLELTCLDSELRLVGVGFNGYHREAFVGLDTVRIANCPR
jgi:hypothetical protein